MHSYHTYTHTQMLIQMNLVTTHIDLLLLVTIHYIGMRSDAHSLFEFIQPNEMENAH